jgi:hypothetical protein
LGRFTTKREADFAGELAILLQQLLTPVQRKQQDILLEPRQTAQIKALERRYPDVSARPTIKEEVALQVLDARQEVIW